MPIPRNRTQAPPLRSRHRSLDGSIASIPSDEVDFEDERVQASLQRGPMATILTEYRTIQAQGGDEAEHDEDDGLEEAEGGR